MPESWTVEEYRQHLVDTGQIAPPIPKAKHKYGAVPTEVDGIRFASMAEANRYITLKRLQDTGWIIGLELQPRFPIVVNGQKCGAYVADFVYINCETGETVIEDVKGVRTPVYRLKRKLTEALHGVTITEVEA